MSSWEEIATIALYFSLYGTVLTRVYVHRLIDLLVQQDTYITELRAEIVDLENKLERERQKQTYYGPG